MPFFGVAIVAQWSQWILLLPPRLAAGFAVDDGGEGCGVL